MTRPRRFKLARWLPTFQFTIANLFTLMSLAAVSLALGRWNWHAGAMLATLLYGVWLAAALANAQWFRGSYFAAAFTAGLLWYAALCIPISPVAEFFNRDAPHCIPALGLCISSLAAAAIFRLFGMHEPGYFPLVSGALFALATSVVFYLILVAVTLVPDLWRTAGSPFALTIPWQLHPALAISALALSSPVIVPCGCLVLYLLRETERLALDAARDERAVFDAVEELERRGQETILSADVAKQAMLPPETVERCLVKLRRREFLEYSGEVGYRCRRSVRR